MEISPAGSITFVISEYHNQDEEITDEMARRIASNFSDYFTSQLTKHHLDKILAVTGIRVYRGCITVVITVGIVAAAGGGFLLVEFFKNYKDVREGINILVNDMKNLQVWVKKKILKKRTTKVVTDTTNATSEPFEIMFQQTFEQYKSMPLELRKFWSGGQEVTIMNDKGEYCKYTVAVKREDIKLPEENTTITESDNKSNPA